MAHGAAAARRGRVCKASWSGWRRPTRSLAGRWGAGWVAEHFADTLRADVAVNEGGGVARRTRRAWPALSACRLGEKGSPRSARHAPWPLGARLGTVACRQPGAGAGRSYPAHRRLRGRNRRLAPVLSRGAGWRWGCRKRRPRKISIASPTVCRTRRWVVPEGRLAHDGHADDAAGGCEIQQHPGSRHAGVRRARAARAGRRLRQARTRAQRCRDSM